MTVSIPGPIALNTLAASMALVTDRVACPLTIWTLLIAAPVAERAGFYACPITSRADHYFIYFVLRIFVVHRGASKILRKISKQSTDQ
jgi:hypothetical protein